MNLPELNLPQYQFRLKSKEEKIYIFDAFRKKDIVLTPEEWVRQNFLEFLVQHKNYPRSWIAVEKEININGLKRRYDALVFNPEGHVQVLVEFKAPHVKITEEVFKQIAAYNFKLEAPFLIVSNGLNHYSAEINFKEQSHTFLKDIPNY
jgi:hypothetical protein